MHRITHAKSTSTDLCIIPEFCTVGIVQNGRRYESSELTKLFSPGFFNRDGNRLIFRPAFLVGTRVWDWGVLAGMERGQLFATLQEKFMLKIGSTIIR
jgi:hypothetical protein